MLLAVSGEVWASMDHAQSAIKEKEIANYFGRKVAIDVSMSIYQFLTAIPWEANQPRNNAGETTSHLMGLFYRTVGILVNGMKPVYVFDGKPPQLKSAELAKRSGRQFSRRFVKVTPQHNKECKELLQYMGVPYIDAPGEAESQCAELVKGGKVYAMASEDLDSLAFGANILLRNLKFNKARKISIQEFHYDKVLEELELAKEQFIDLCILLGCDYCQSIKGVGPVKALKLIKEYKCIEDAINPTKYTIPENWLYKESRDLFINPDITPACDIELKWREPDEEKLVELMVKKNGFAEKRIRNGAKKMFKVLKDLDTNALK